MDNVGLIYFIRYSDCTTADIILAIAKYYVEIYWRNYIITAITNFVQCGYMAIEAFRQEFVDVGDSLLDYWIKIIDEKIVKNAYEIDDNPYILTIDCVNYINPVICCTHEKYRSEDLIIRISNEQLRKLVEFSLKYRWKVIEYDDNGRIYDLINYKQIW